MHGYFKVFYLNLNHLITIIKHALVDVLKHPPIKRVKSFLIIKERKTQ